MTATSKQEPPTPTENPVVGVVADAPADAAEAVEVAAKRRKAATATGSVASVAEAVTAEAPAATKAAKAKPATQPNNVRKLRQAAMMSKAELARRAGVSPLTIDRVESGCPCRMDTKRKILEALGLKPEAREQVFGPDIDQA
ncbi:MAG: helix-turn-helix transcriptional regulator [Myxococcales bacterium]|nr:helix-turn-helix transcriptional regulator [Myxococcales bacterium]